MLGSDVT